MLTILDLRKSEDKCRGDSVGAGNIRELAEISWRFILEAEIEASINVGHSSRSFRVWIS
jgi:hypothetical protein